MRKSKRGRTGKEQEAEKRKCTQNEKMIRFMRSEATKFVAVLKNPHYCTSWALAMAFEVL